MTSDAIREVAMLFLIATVLVVVWVLSFVIFHVTGAFIHLLLLAAVVVGAIRLFRGADAGHDADPMNIEH